jgi:hypothetical protein
MTAPTARISDWLAVAAASADGAGAGVEAATEAGNGLLAGGAAAAVGPFIPGPWQETAHHDNATAIKATARATLDMSLFSFRICDWSAH